jgi:hypothetical protein
MVPAAGHCTKKEARFLEENGPLSVLESRPKPSLQPGSRDLPSLALSHARTSGRRETGEL